MMSKKSLLAFICGMLFSLVSLSVFAGESPNLKTIPMDMGLPVQVATGVNFLKVDSINENDGVFEGTVDINLVWVDHRLKFDKSIAPIGYLSYKNDEATQKLDEIWRRSEEYTSELQSH